MRYKCKAVCVLVVRSFWCTSHLYLKKGTLTKLLCDLDLYIENYYNLQFPLGTVFEFDYIMVVACNLIPQWWPLLRNILIDERTYGVDALFKLQYWLTALTLWCTATAELPFCHLWQNIYNQAESSLNLCVILFPCLHQPQLSTYYCSSSTERGFSRKPRFLGCLKLIHQDLVCCIVCHRPIIYIYIYI